jgi:hypothetical protein
MKLVLLVFLASIGCADILDIGTVGYAHGPMVDDGDAGSAGDRSTRNVDASDAGEDVLVANDLDRDGTAMCTSVTHYNGLNGGWHDCVPSYTYNAAEAMNACRSALNGYDGGGVCADIPVDQTATRGCPNAALVRLDAANGEAVGWFYTSLHAGALAGGTGAPGQPLGCNEPEGLWY